MNSTFTIIFYTLLALSFCSWFLTDLFKQECVSEGMTFSRKGWVSFDRIRRAKTRRSNKLFAKRLNQLATFHSINIFLILLCLASGLILYLTDTHEFKVYNTDITEKYWFLSGWDD